MSQKTYMYDTQWTALITAINGGDTSAIATALGQIKTSVDSITTALGSLSADVTQDATQWSDLITAIGSGGGGGGGTVDIDATQWADLLTSIDKGDTSALATALGLIKTSVDLINTSLGSLNVGVSQNVTQWSNLVNAIINQSLTVDLSNITSDVVSNESTVTPADTVTEALDVLKSDLNNKLNITDPVISGVLQDSDLTINNKQIINGIGSTVWVGNPLATTILQDITGNKNVANLVDKNPQEISLVVNGGIAAFTGHAYRIGKVIYVSGQLTAKQNINAFSTIMSGFPTPKDGFDILVPASNNTTGSLYVTQAGILSNRSALSSGVVYLISGSYIES